MIIFLFVKCRDIIFIKHRNAYHFLNALTVLNLFKQPLIMHGCYFMHISFVTRENLSIYLSSYLAIIYSLRFKMFDTVDFLAYI